MRGQKLGIIGTGHVGELVLAHAMVSDLFSDIVVLDIREDKAYGEALDQSHATGSLGRNNINVFAGTYEDFADCDIIAVTLTYVYEDGQAILDRQELLGKNAGQIRSVMDQLTAVTKEPILIFVTNPVDTCTFIAVDEYDYPRERVMGTGCMLDSARLRYILGDRYGVDPKSVSGFMYGEHGVTAFPVLSHTTIGGIPYYDLEKYFPEIETLSNEKVQDLVVNAAHEVFNAKAGVTNSAIAQVTIDLCRSILLDEKTIHPISVPMYDGEFNTERPIVFSAPTIVGRGGYEKVLETELNEWEQEKLNETINYIYKSIDYAKSLLD